MQTRSIISGENGGGQPERSVTTAGGRSAKPREWRAADAINLSVGLYRESSAVFDKEERAGERDGAAGGGIIDEPRHGRS